MENTRPNLKATKKRRYTVIAIRQTYGAQIGMKTLFSRVVIDPQGRRPSKPASVSLSDLVSTVIIPQNGSIFNKEYIITRSVSGE
jgi:hypothetical protein